MLINYFLFRVRQKNSVDTTFRFAGFHAYYSYSVVPRRKRTAFR